MKYIVYKCSLLDKDLKHLENLLNEEHYMVESSNIIVAASQYDKSHIVYILKKDPAWA